MDFMHTEGEPRVSSTDEELEVLPLGVVGLEVSPRSFGGLGTLDLSIGVNVVGTGGQEVVDILGGLLHVALDVHGESRGLGDGETGVEGDDGGNATETDEDTPHLVKVREHARVIVEDGALVAADDDERDEGGGWRQRHGRQYGKLSAQLRQYAQN